MRTRGLSWACRQTDPDDSDRNLFYLVLKKDGSTELPALGAVFMPPQQHGDLPDMPSGSLPSQASSADQRQSLGLSAQQQPHNTLHVPSTNLLATEQQPATASTMSIATVTAAPAAHAPSVLDPAALAHATTASLAPPSVAHPPAAEPSVQVAQHSLSAGLASSTHRIAAGLASYPAQALQHAQPPSAFEHAQQDNIPKAEEGVGGVVCDPDHMLDSHLQEVSRMPKWGHMPQQSPRSEHSLPGGCSSQLVSNPPVHAADRALQLALSCHSEHQSQDFVEVPPHAPPCTTEVKQATGSSAHCMQQPVRCTQLQDVVLTDIAPHTAVDPGSPQQAITEPAVTHARRAFVPADESDHSQHPVEQLTSTKRLVATSEIAVTHRVAPSSAPLPAPAALCATPLASASPPMLPSPDPTEVAVVSPRQGELKGVLALACTQIIARQQARSPNTFPHRQQPSQALSAFQPSTSTTPGQHSPHESAPETGHPVHNLVTEQPQCNPHTHQQAVLKAREHSHTGQQGEHSHDQPAMPSTAPQAQHVMLQPPTLPAQLLQSEPAQLLEDEWTGMLIDQPDTGQAEATQQVSICSHPAAAPQQSLVIEQHDQVQPALLHDQLHTAQQHPSNLQVSDVEMHEAVDPVQGPGTAAPGKAATAAEIPTPAKASDGNVSVTAGSRLGNSINCGNVPAANQLLCDVSNSDSSSAAKPPTFCYDGQQRISTGLGLSVAAAPEEGGQLDQQARQSQTPTVNLELNTSACPMQVTLTDQHDQRTSEGVPAAMISAPHLDPTQASQSASHAATPPPHPYTEPSTAPQAEVSTLGSTGPTLPAERPHTRSNSLHSTANPPHATLQEPGSAERTQQPATASDSKLEPPLHHEAIELAAGQAERAEPLLQPHLPTLPIRLHTSSAQHLQEAVSLDTSEAQTLAEHPEDVQATFEHSGAEQRADHCQETEAADEQINAQQCNGEPEVNPLQTAASDAARFNAQSTSSLSAQSSEPSQQESEVPKQLQMPKAAAMSQPLSQLDSSAPSPPHPAVVSNRADATEPHHPRPHLRRSSRGPASILADAAAGVVSAAPKSKQPAKHAASPVHSQKQARHTMPAATTSTAHKKHTRKQQQLIEQCVSLPRSPRALRNSTSRVQNGKRKRPELSDVDGGEDSQPVTSAVKLANSLAGKKRKSGGSR